MSLQYPSNPLNAHDAKLIADNAVVQAKKPATDQWLSDTNTAINAAATAGNFSVTVTCDPSVVDVDVIVSKLCALGYSIARSNTSNNMGINWISVARLKFTPDSNPGSNFGYEQPNSN